MGIPIRILNSLPARNAMLALNQHEKHPILECWWRKILTLALAWLSAGHVVMEHQEHIQILFAALWPLPSHPYTWDSVHSLSLVNSQRLSAVNFRVNSMRTSWTTTHCPNESSLARDWCERKPCSVALCRDCLIFGFIESILVQLTWKNKIAGKVKISKFRVYGRELGWKRVSVFVTWRKKKREKIFIEWNAFTLKYTCKKLHETVPCKEKS